MALNILEAYFDFSQNLMPLKQLADSLLCPLIFILNKRCWGSNCGQVVPFSTFFIIFIPNPILYPLPPSSHHFKQVRLGVKLAVWLNCAIFHAIISMQQPATAQPMTMTMKSCFQKMFQHKPLKSNNECPVYK